MKRFLQNLVILSMVPSVAFADIFFCNHIRQTGKEGATPEVVITSKDESIQQGAVLSVRCNVDKDGLQVLLVVHEQNYQGRRPVLRFTTGVETVTFSALPSRLGNAFLLPNNHEREIVSLLKTGKPLTLEIFAGEQDKKASYLFNLSRIDAFFSRLPCVQP